MFLIIASLERTGILRTDELKHLFSSVFQFLFQKTEFSLCFHLFFRVVFVFSDFSEKMSFSSIFTASYQHGPKNLHCRNHTHHYHTGKSKKTSECHLCASQTMTILAQVSDWCLQPGTVSVASTLQYKRGLLASWKWHAPGHCHLPALKAEDKACIQAVHKA